MTDTLTSPRTKGPLVWLDMDQQALDDAYDQAVYAPNREQVHARRAANSAVARAVLGEPLRLQYGSSEIEGSLATEKEETPWGARRNATRVPGRTVCGSRLNSTPLALSSATIASMPLTTSPK